MCKKIYPESREEKLVYILYLKNCSTNLLLKANFSTFSILKKPGKLLISFKKLMRILK